MRSTRFQPVTLPSDMAGLLIDDGIAAPSPTDMSAPPGMFEAVMNISATVITLIQGPVTVAQAISYLKKWKKLRQERGEATGELMLRHPSGNVDVVLTSDSDLAKAGQALADLVNAVQLSRIEPEPTAFDDLGT